eukprot:Gb_14140 [translate_table: standard]
MNATTFGIGASPLLSLHCVPVYADFKNKFGVGGARDGTSGMQFVGDRDKGRWLRAKGFGRRLRPVKCFSCRSYGKEEDIDRREEVSDNTIPKFTSDPSQVETNIPPDVQKGAMDSVSLGGGTRAGLFRTPSSGGVQSATAAHGLPHPAVAVRNLMEQAHYGHLCTIMSRMHHRRRGYPFGSLVDFVPDHCGHPIFCFSPLAIHTRNVLADPRCTLVVQVPGWSGLENARVALFGDVYPMSTDQQEWAHKYFLSKHPQGTCQQWGNFSYYRMEKISDIYFVGGFGTVAWVDVNEYASVQPDPITENGVEHSVEVLNQIFSKSLKKVLSDDTWVDDATIISIDSKGIDIRVLQGNQKFN